MDTARNITEGQYFDQRGAARFLQKRACDKFRMIPHKKAGKNRQAYRQNQSDQQIKSGSCRILLPNLTGYKS